MANSSKLLTADDVGGRHRYIARNLEGWERGMAGIRAEGGPWKCRNGHASLLVYRCSVCAGDMAGEG